MQFLRYLCACRNHLFFGFSKYLKNYKEYLKWQGRFQVLLSTILYTKSSMKTSWLESSLTSCNIFSKSWSLCSDKFHIKKIGDVTACFLCTVKKQTKFQKQPDSWLICEIWAQLQILLKNAAWIFQNTFFAEHISVAASWNYVIVSTLSLKIGLIQTFLNNTLDSQ